MTVRHFARHPSLYASALDHGLRRRGNYPIKFNGSIFTVDPKFTGGPISTPIGAAGAIAIWWQNTRLPYFPMIARGDFDECRPCSGSTATPCRSARPGRSSITTSRRVFPRNDDHLRHYANGDYGWDRKGHKPNEMLCPYWQYAWQQGLELVALMLDYYEHTEDAKFLSDELIPMAHDVLGYYDTRFQRDAGGKLVISPTQAVETYWFDVVNDTPSVAGLARRVEPAAGDPADKTPAAEREFWQKMQAAAPPLPLQTKNGKTWILPAEKFKPQRKNCENPELYADLAVPTVWRRAARSRSRRRDLSTPHRKGVVRLAIRRSVRRDPGPGRRSEAHPAGQDRQLESRPSLSGHVGTKLRLAPRPGPWQQYHADVQTCVADPAGDRIFVLPAWPKDWNVSFKLHAPHRTVVECVYRGGKLEGLQVTPEARRKDVQLPAWLVDAPRSGLK